MQVYSRSITDICAEGQRSECTINVLTLPVLSYCTVVRQTLLTNDLDRGVETSGNELYVTCFFKLSLCNQLNPLSYVAVYL